MDRFTISMYLPVWFSDCFAAARNNAEMMFLRTSVRRNPGPIEILQPVT